jgi:hypothetical protein
MAGSSAPKRGNRTHGRDPYQERFPPGRGLAFGHRALNAPSQLVDECRHPGTRAPRSEIGSHDRRLRSRAGVPDSLPLQPDAVRQGTSRTDACVMNRARRADATVPPTPAWAWVQRRLASQARA